MMHSMDDETANYWAEGALFTMTNCAPNMFGKGVDISAAMQPQFAIWPTDASAAEIGAYFLGGPIVSTLSTLADPMLEGGINVDTGKASAQKLVPRALRGPARAIGIAPYTMAGAPEGAVESTAAFLGFNPSRISMRQDAISRGFEVGDEKKEVIARAKLILKTPAANLRLAEKSGDEKRIEKAMKTMDKAEEKARKVVEDWHTKMENRDAPRKSWLVDYKRDVAPAGKYWKQDMRNEQLPGWRNE
jgi:hypothetical protein